MVMCALGNANLGGSARPGMPFDQWLPPKSAVPIFVNFGRCSEDRGLRLLDPGAATINERRMATFAKRNVRSVNDFSLTLCRAV
jgi:hypothetical protein